MGKLYRNARKKYWGYLLQPFIHNGRFSGDQYFTKIRVF